MTPFVGRHPSRDLEARAMLRKPSQSRTQPAPVEGLEGTSWKTTASDTASSEGLPRGGRVRLGAAAAVPGVPVKGG